MAEVALLSIVALTAGLFGFLGFLSFLAYTNISKNSKKDYLINESQKGCDCNCETTSMLIEKDEVKTKDGASEKENNVNVSKVIKVSGIGKRIGER
jgi:hypothetical protein